MALSEGREAALKDGSKDGGDNFCEWWRRGGRSRGNRSRERDKDSTLKCNCVTWGSQMGRTCGRTSREN